MAFVEKKHKLFVHSIKVSLNDQQSSTSSQPFFSKRQRTAYIFSTSQKNSNYKALLYKNPPGNGFILVWSRKRHLERSRRKNNAFFWCPIDCFRNWLRISKVGFFHPRSVKRCHLYWQSIVFLLNSTYLPKVKLPFFYARLSLVFLHVLVIEFANHA